MLIKIISSLIRITLLGAALNLGRTSPNLVSIPENEDTANRNPPIWSGWRETSGLTGVTSVFVYLIKVHEI